MSDMILVYQIMKRLSFVAIALAIALSGVGMEAAHAKASQDAHSIHASHAKMGQVDHNAHATMAHHVDHVALADTPDEHEGHSDCAMAACCHLGGIAMISAQSIVEVSEANFASLVADQYRDAEKNRADKPPKHI